MAIHGHDFRYAKAPSASKIASCNFVEPEGLPRIVLGTPYPKRKARICGPFFLDMASPRGFEPLLPP